VFASLEAAVRGVNWGLIEQCSGRPLGYTMPSSYGREIYYGGDPVEFMDEMLLVIPIAIVRRVAMEGNCHLRTMYWGRWYRKTRYGFQPTYTFRDGPVPWTRCWRGGRSGRGMNTHQEIRENDFLEEFDEEAAEYGIKPRRRRLNLPTWWDDRPQKRDIRKNWKKYRSHQWK
jgi:hypothetical protein